jgi:hypothetical protein
MYGELQMVRALVWIIVILATSAPVRAGGIESIQFAVKAGVLNGDVYCCESIAPDGKIVEPGQPVGDVAIEECNSEFRQCVPVVTADHNGRFAIKSTKNAKIHYLKFSLDGFNQDWVKITLKHGAKPLHVRMSVGT